MKKLQHYINEGLLDDDFDVTVEPIEVKSIRNNDLANWLQDVVKLPNDIIRFFPVLTKLAEVENEFVSISSGQTVSRDISMIRSYLSSAMDKAKQYIDQKKYNGAISELNRLRGFISDVTVCDNLLDKMIPDYRKFWYEKHESRGKIELAVRCPMNNTDIFDKATEEINKLKLKHSKLFRDDNDRYLWLVIESI